MKKKGLIVATIVMVLVLAVSLTTATYAWFSSTAEAKIQNLNVQAAAVEGVEIAVKTTDLTHYSLGYTNGTLAYDTATGYWSSEEENNGFGTLLDFGSVQLGTITNAVTKATGTGLEVYTAAEVSVGASVAAYYTIDPATTVISKCGSSDVAVADVTYYSKGASIADHFYRPVGYDAQLRPTGYYEVLPNIPAISYYDLPLAVKTTKAATAVVCSLSITNKATGSLLPGMAAATRVEITINGNTYSWAPYSSTTYTQGSGMSGYSASEGVLNFVLMHGDITSADICDFRIVLWVEGTDNECNNTTLADTNFDVDFAFDFVSTAVTKDAAFTQGGKTYQWLKVSTDEVYDTITHSQP